MNVEELDQKEQVEEVVAQPQEDTATPEIEVVDDTPEQDRRPPRVGEPKVEDPGDEELPKRVQKRIGQITYNYHEERRRAEAAERQRDEAIAWAKRIYEQSQEAHNRAAQGERIAIESTHARFAAEIDKAREDLRTAYEAGDATKIADASARIAQISGRQVMVPQVPQAPAAPPAVPQAPQPAAPPQPQVDPVLMENTNRWMSENAHWFQRDEEMTSSAIILHNQLKANGVIPGSVAYFNIIDARLKELFPDRFEDVQQDTLPKTTQKKPSIVAPATRSATASTQVKRVTKTQAEMAKRLGVPLSEYVKYM